MKILFLISTPKTYTHEVIFDRPDLIRKVCAINTWVEDVLIAGYDVVFFQGSSEVEYYDAATKTLHLPVDDSYEPVHGISNLYIKHQAAYNWVLKNKEFDIVYSCDDDVYVNLPEFLKMNLNIDFAGITAGAGFLFSRKALEIIVNHTNTIHRVADHAIFSAIQQHAGSDFIRGGSEYNLNQGFYIPGELAPTVHYVTGKRMYYLHYMLKNFRETGVTNRKIVLGGPFKSDCANPWDIVNYQTTSNQLTPRWYDFVMDPNGWEYHCGYQRSGTSYGQLTEFWPYAENATKYFVLTPNTFIYQWWKDPDYYYQCLQKLIEKCEHSLINKNNLILCHFDGPVFELNGWKLNNSVKETLKLNFEALNNCNFYTKDGFTI